MSPPRERESQRDRVRERFTRTAKAFGDFALAKRSAEAETLAQLVGPAGQEKALDIACGPGTLTLAFAPRVKWICGLDLTPALLERARRSSAAENFAHVAFALGDAMALPFASASLDLVLCSYSLHHVPDPEAVIEEAARVLRPDGRLGLLDLIAPEDAAEAAANNEIERTRDASHTRTLPASEIEQRLGRAGFGNVRSKVEEHPRLFDDWMRVAGWEQGQPAYDRTRRVMVASIPGDTAGFHPRLMPADNQKLPEIEFVQTALFVVAERTGQR